MMSFDKYRISNWVKFSLFLCFLIGGGCKSTEKVKEGPTEIKYEFQCSQEEYIQNRENFRVFNIGESVDKPTSMKKGIQVAQQELSGSIKIVLNKTIESYLAKDGLQIDQIMKDSIIAITEPIGEELIERVNVICEESIKTLNGLYRTYVVLEISAYEVLDELKKKMEGNNQFQVDFIAPEFKEIFENQMDKTLK